MFLTGLDVWNRLARFGRVRALLRVLRLGEEFGLGRDVVLGVVVPTPHRYRAVALLEVEGVGYTQVDVFCVWQVWDEARQCNIKK